jgi:type VI secretion system protein ImpC
MPVDHPRGATGSLGEATLDVTLGHVVSAAPRPEEPFRVAVLGNFRGRGERDVDATSTLLQRSPVAVDRDNFDEVLAHFAPELTISLSETGPELSIRFQELDDFHPDRLFENLPLFRSLRETRRRLSDPATFREAARELWGPPHHPPTAAPPADTAPPVEAGGLLDRILGEPQQMAPAPASRQDDLADYIRRVVAPHRIPGADPRQPEALAQFDTAISGQMRAVLHHPDFQALEALWRGVLFVVRRVETDTRLRFYLLDVSRSELAADLETDRELEQTALYRLLVESAAETLGGTPWALLIGNEAFGPRPAELRRLQRLGRLARRAGGPWIGAADPLLVGCPGFGEAAEPDLWTAPGSEEWDELRRSPDAAWLGLVLPRFLLRLPYGEHGEPCDSFRFEEADTGFGHERYLWGNPALACALLLAQSFSAAGWTMRPGAHVEIDRLPLHLVRYEGGIEAKPCAEAWMTERAATRILECGVMPLASIKDMDAVKLIRFQSVASPPAALAGRWERSTR